MLEPCPDNHAKVCATWARRDAFSDTDEFLTQLAGGFDEHDGQIFIEDSEQP